MSPLILVLVLVPGPWSLVPGPWSLVPGPWSLVLGPQSLVPGSWSLVQVADSWSLIPGSWAAWRPVQARSRPIKVEMAQIENLSVVGLPHKFRIQIQNKQSHMWPCLFCSLCKS